jgi:hypothetical protein
MTDIVWLVATKDGNGLNATAHRSQREAFAYLRGLHRIPADIPDENLAEWIEANTHVDEILIDYDEY